MPPRTPFCRLPPEILQIICGFATEGSIKHGRCPTFEDRWLPDYSKSIKLTKFSLLLTSKALHHASRVFHAESFDLTLEGMQAFLQKLESNVIQGTSVKALCFCCSSAHAFTLVALKTAAKILFCCTKLRTLDITGFLDQVPTRCVVL